MPTSTPDIGPGANLLTLSGGGKSRVFDIEGRSLALDGMTITGGLANLGTMTLNHVKIRCNSATTASCLFSGRSAMLITRSAPAELRRRNGVSQFERSSSSSIAPGRASGPVNTSVRGLLARSRKSFEMPVPERPRLACHSVEAVQAVGCLSRTDRQPASGLGRSTQ
jgi:hypothetical protein